VKTPETTIDLIRHGLPEGGRRYRGHGCDDPLSEMGWQQMWGTVGDAAPWEQIVSSTMLRCRHFAEALGERRGIPVATDERLREVGFGDWEGLTRDQVMARDAVEYHAFYLDPVNNRPRGAEPLDLFAARVVAAVDDLLSRYAGRHLLVVAHAGVIRAALGHVLEAPARRWYRIRVDNGGLSRLRFGRHGGVLVAHNLLNTPGGG
jgi:alpha-ribazole phosphatase